MPFDVRDSICIRGGTVMEDRMGYGSRYLYVIDGATVIRKGEPVFQTYLSDAAWLSSRLASSLEELLPRHDLSIERCVTWAAENAKREFDAMCELSEIYSPPYPSASVAILRLREGKLEYFGLGDCTAVIELKNGELQILEEKELTRLDALAIKEIVQYARDHSCTVSQALEYSSDILVAHRNLRNLEGGYWIFDPTGKGISHARQLTWAVSDVKSVSLMTDGFAQLVAPMKKFGNAGALHMELEKENGGMSKLVLDLLSTEEQDQTCDRYPRFRAQDDATAIFAALI